MTRLGLLVAACALAGCDATPFVPPPPSECAAADYPAWQTSDYVLPYPAGTVYLALQGNCGGFSHTSGSVLAFAVDFRMPIGEAVTAMRGGTVSEVEASYTDFDNVRGHENAVVVDHGDGTVGVYLHFTLDGAAVAVGDVVAQSDTLGRSGHSGLSTEPHLHVDVRRGCPDACEGVPITFRNTSPNPRGLVGGVPYIAQAP